MPRRWLPSLIHLFGVMCKKRKFHTGYSKTRWTKKRGEKSSQSVRVLIKYMHHCPIIRGVVWPQQWIMDPVIVVGS